MSAAYLDPRTGQTFPLDQPRWCGPDHAPLLLTALPGLRREQIDSATRSLWRYRAAFPMQVDDADQHGRRLHAADPPDAARRAGAPEMRVVHAHRQLQGPRRQRHAVAAARAGRARRAGGQLRQRRRRGVRLRRRRRTASHDHGARLHQPGEDRADARARRERGARSRARGRTPPTPRCVAPRPCSTPATTGTRSSCTAPRRWPTSCGKTSASARPTTSSRRAAPDRTCSAARSALPNCCAPARSTPCRASSRPSRRIAARSPRPSSPAAIPPVATDDPADHCRRHRDRAADPPDRGARRAARNAGRRGDAERGGDRAPPHSILRGIGIYVEPTAAQAAAAFAKLLAAGTVTPEQTTVLVLTGSGLKATPRIAELLGVTLMTR